MEQKVHAIIRRSLKNLGEGERDAAMTQLIVVGLKHYDLLYAGQDIHMPILEYLCGMKSVYLTQCLLLINRALLCRQVCR
jgi:hypothetical protein